MESFVKKKGWSKASFGMMRQINSSLKESQCLVGSGAGESSDAIAEGGPANAFMGLVNLRQMAIKDFTFSDGTFIPKATTIVVPSRCLRLDNAHVFDLVRFSNMCDEWGTKHQFVSTSMKNTPDTGALDLSTRMKHLTCMHVSPGRLFAANADIHVGPCRHVTRCQAGR